MSYHFYYKNPHLNTHYFSQVDFSDILTNLPASVPLWSLSSRCPYWFPSSFLRVHCAHSSKETYFPQKWWINNTFSSSFHENYSNSWHFRPSLMQPPWPRASSSLPWITATAPAWVSCFVFLYSLFSAQQGVKPCPFSAQIPSVIPDHAR